MSSVLRSISVPLKVTLGAALWATVLVLAWAIHPVDGVATVVPVANPTAEEQASILRIRNDEGPGRLVRRFPCDDSPLAVATGGGTASAAPTPDVGLEYVQPPCSVEYRAARSALWVNILAVGLVVAASIALHIRLRARHATR